jgi:adenylosuccinate lyase
MAVHVMDSKIFRTDFIAPEIRDIFEEKAVVESWLMFEGFLAEVQGELGIIPLDMAKEIKTKASLKYVNFDRIVEIYPKTKLASVATIRALAEVCENNASEYIHYGSCTPEVFENTLSYRIGKAMDVFEQDLKEIRSLLINLAQKHKHTLMVDRSHGQQGNPTTFGLVAAIWSEEVQRHIDRFQEARKRILLGSLKGAYGNSASYFAIAGEKCVEMEKRVLGKMGLHPGKVSIRRHLERLAEFLNLLSLLAVTFEKICNDIFFQQRNEINELQEPFDSKNQIGSSTLPQKRNPVYSEAIIAWCKKIRSNTAAFLEIQMRDSHDIIGFYMEDLIIPESCILTGSLLNTAKYILGNLIVKKEAMLKNLQLSNGLIMTEALSFALSQKTKKKQTAHAILHKMAMESFEKGLEFDQVVLENADIGKHLTSEEIKALLNPNNYLGMNDPYIERITKS